MKPHRVPADPAKTIKDYLALLLPSLVDGTVSYGLVLPEAWTPESDTALVVFDDSGSGVWPFVTQPTIRVTVWASGRDRANMVAGQALGLLMTNSVPGVANIGYPSGVLEARDSKTGGVLASFTVRAQSRTLPV